MSENDMAKIARLVADPHADFDGTASRIDPCTCSWSPSTCPLHSYDLATTEALRARVAKLEEVIQTQNGVVVSGTLKLNEARARVVKLEAALRAERPGCCCNGPCVRVEKLDALCERTRRIDAALKDAPQ